MVKETLFNMIQNRIPGCRFLDLFAGTGNVGIEALSRNAAQAAFVEKHPGHFRILTRNLDVCGVQEKSLVYHGDANKLLHVFNTHEMLFDIIFLDPPYRQTRMLEDMLQRLVEYGLLDEQGLIVVEHAAGFTPRPRALRQLNRTKVHRAGDTGLSFYQAREARYVTRIV